MDEEMVGKDVGVLSVRRQAVVKAGERDFKEANEGVCRECGPEVLDVDRGVAKGYCVVLSLGLHGLYGLRRGQIGRASCRERVCQYV